MPKEQSRYEVFVTIGIIGLIVLFILAFVAILEHTEKKGKDACRDRLSAVVGDEGVPLTLRRLGPRTDLQGGIGGGFLVIAGDIATIPKIAFSWMTTRGDYVYSAIPLNRVRVRMRAISTVEIRPPELRLGFRPSRYGPSFCEMTEDALINRYLVSADLLINEVDWPQKFDIP